MLLPARAPLAQLLPATISRARAAQLCSRNLPLSCRRGKRKQKHYTVFVAALSPEDKAAFQPQLNHEHSEARWFRVSELLGEDAPALHPVVTQLLQGSERKELAAALPLWADSSAAAPAGAPLDKKQKKHPVEKVGAGLLLV